jgi:hypothetical protein
VRDQFPKFGSCAKSPKQIRQQLAPTARRLSFDIGQSLA